METTPPITPTVEAAAASARTGLLKHLGLGSYWFGTYFVITPLYTVLLQVQVADVGVARDTQGTAIGLATGLGGLLAMVVPPVVGAWSDGLSTRFGRRRPIMLAGTLGIVLALLVLLAAHSYPRSSTSRAPRTWR